MASTWFTNGARSLATGKFDFSVNTLKVLLVSSIPTETNLDSWVNRSDVTNEITGTGYTAAGIAQAFTFPAVDTTNNRQAITLTNIVNGWTAATFSAVGAIIYKNSGVAATDTLMEFIDFGGTVSCSSGNFSITYSSDAQINRV